jgi:hypothetical protein
MYCEKRLSFSDFDNILPGRSTMRDLNEIDPATDTVFAQRYNQIAYLSSDVKKTVHMTKEGYVLIRYKKNIFGKAVVESIEKINDDFIERISPKDLVPE